MLEGAYCEENRTKTHIARGACERARERRSPRALVLDPNDGSTVRANWPGRGGRGTLGSRARDFAEIILLQDRVSRGLYQSLVTVYFCGAEAILYCVFSRCFFGGLGVELSFSGTTAWDRLIFLTSQNSEVC